MQAPDGTIWKVAASSKKNKRPGGPEFEHLVLLLGVEDVKASKEYYVTRGSEVGEELRRQVRRVRGPAPDIKLVSLQPRAARQGRRRRCRGNRVAPILVVSDAGDFTDPDGYVWSERI